VQRLLVKITQPVLRDTHIQQTNVTNKFVYTPKTTLSQTHIQYVATINLLTKILFFMEI
jgi:hypothetical protein